MFFFTELLKMCTTSKLLVFAIFFLCNQASLTVHLPALGTENHDEVCYSYDYNDALSHRLLSKYLICENMDVQLAKPSVLLNAAPEDVQYIAFKNSSLPLITKEMFANFLDLLILNLEKSKISVVSPQAFSDMAQLQELYLQNNNIRGFIRGTFDFVTNLKVLDLSNNVLVLLQQELLSSLTSLKVLKLANNSLNFLDRDCFSALRSLEVLDLTNNNMLLDPFQSVFHIHSQTLTRVWASGNLFFEFPVMGNLTQLTFLDVSYNRWTQVDLHQFSYIKFANVSHNRIVTVCTLAEAATENVYLEELDLSYNLIKRINKSDFGNLTHIQRLHLNNNFIKELAHGCFANFKNMTFLSLSFNQLEYLDIDYFTGLKKLITLQLDHNNLFKQSKGFSFSDLKNLRYLHIDNNLYNSIDAERIIKELPKLEMITLKNNRWHCEQISEAIKIFHNKSITVAEKQDEEPYIIDNACPVYLSDCMHNMKLEFLFFNVSGLFILMIMISIIILSIRRQYLVLRVVIKKPKKNTTIRIHDHKSVVMRMTVPGSAVRNVH